MVANLMQQLRRDEGQRLKPYQDTVGKWTIGVGRNLSDKGISEAESDSLLHNDIVDATAAVLEALPWSKDLDDARFGVLINMAFNMGIGGLLTFTTTLGYIKSGLWNAASDAMLKSKWAREVGDRATRLAEQIRTGVWQ